MTEAAAKKRRKNFIIIIQKEKLENDELIPELKRYLKKYTYIDATENVDN